MTQRGGSQWQETDCCVMGAGRGSQYDGHLIRTSQTEADHEEDTSKGFLKEAIPNLHLKEEKQEV